MKPIKKYVIRELDIEVNWQKLTDTEKDEIVCAFGYHVDVYEKWFRTFKRKSTIASEY